MILLVLQGVLLKETKSTYGVACKIWNIDGFGPATGLASRAPVFYGSFFLKKYAHIQNYMLNPNPFEKFQQMSRKSWCPRTFEQYTITDENRIIPSLFGEHFCEEFFAIF